MGITSLAPSAAQDASQRMRRYLVLMGIRAACFLGAVALQHWTRWLLLLGAVVLPYVAVVIANAAGTRTRDPGTLLGAVALPAAAPVTEPPVAKPPAATTEEAGR